MDYTFEAYKELVNLSIENNYKISSYDDVDAYDKNIILRHDIDFCPEKALEIAKIEYGLGVKSTYFVLLSTEFYNVFSRESSRIFSEILDMGHHIGLHFDEQRYETSSIEQIKEHIYYEKEMLGRALSTQIRVVSMHRPSQFTLDSSIELDGLINSYSSKYFKEMKYISDSRMHWREDPIAVISSNKYNKIHILTHPFWYSSISENTKQKLSRLIESSKLNTYKNLYNNFRSLDEFIKESDIDGDDNNVRKIYR
jgi:hypothetical protein